MQLFGGHFYIMVQMVALQQLVNIMFTKSVLGDFCGNF